MKKIIIIIVLLLLYQACSYEESPAQKEENNEIAYIGLQKQRIKAVLKDPESAQFKSMFVSKSMGVPVVCGLVNSKNSFGGYSGFQRVLSAGDMQAIESDMPAGEMDKIWNKACRK